MAAIRPVPLPVHYGDMDLTVVAGRPVSLPKLLDRNPDGTYPFKWHRGPSVLTEWLKRRKP